MIQHVLHPRKVCISGRGSAVDPAGIILQLLSAPVFQVEWRICHNKICFQIGVLVVQKAVCILFAEIKSESADHHIHRRQTPGCRIGFLSIDGNSINSADMFTKESFALNKESAGTHCRVKDTPVIRFQNLHDQGNNRFRSIELSAFFSLCQSKLSEEIFINMPENIFRFHCGMFKWNRTNKVNQPRQFFLINLKTCVIFVQQTFQFRIFFFNGIQCIINQTSGTLELVNMSFPVFDFNLLTDCQPAVILQHFPASQRRNPENIICRIIVPDFQFRIDFIQINCAKKIIAFRISKKPFQLFSAGIESITYIFDKDQSQHDIFILAGINGRT